MSGIKEKIGFGPEMLFRLTLGLLALLAFIITVSFKMKVMFYDDIADFTAEESEKGTVYFGWEKFAKKYLLVVSIALVCFYALLAVGCAYFMGEVSSLADESKSTEKWYLYLGSILIILICALFVVVCIASVRRLAEPPMDETIDKDSWEYKEHPPSGWIQNKQRDNIYYLLLRFATISAVLAMIPWSWKWDSLITFAKSMVYIEPSPETPSEQPQSPFQPFIIPAGQPQVYGYTLQQLDQL